MPEKSYADTSYISLETFKRDGNGVKTPVWCAPVGDEIAIFTEGSAYKVKRLRRDQNVRVARCDVRGKVRGEWCAGTGRIVDSSDEEGRAYAALRKKYGLMMYLTDFLSTLSGRIKRRKVLMLKLDAPQ